MTWLIPDLEGSFWNQNCSELFCFFVLFSNALWIILINVGRSSKRQKAQWIEEWRGFLNYFTENWVKMYLWSKIFMSKPPGKMLDKGKYEIECSAGYNASVPMLLAVVCSPAIPWEPDLSLWSSGVIFASSEPLRNHLAWFVSCRVTLLVWWQIKFGRWWKQKKPFKPFSKNKTFQNEGKSTSYWFWIC